MKMLVPVKVEELEPDMQEKVSPTSSYEPQLASDCLAEKMLKICFICTCTIEETPTGIILQSPSLHRFNSARNLTICK